jgi:hypothetical protein
MSVRVHARNVRLESTTHTSILGAFYVTLDNTLSFLVQPYAGYVRLGHSQVLAVLSPALPVRLERTLWLVRARVQRRVLQHITAQRLLTPVQHVLQVHVAQRVRAAARMSVLQAHIT